MLSIRLLGAIEITLDGARLALNRRKSRALLYFLAAHPQPVSRNRLLAILWADHTPETARSNLRSTLYNLRQAIGAHLVADGETVQLGGALAVDVRHFAASDFHTLLRDTLAAEGRATDTPFPPIAARLSKRLDHYQGDFLAGFELPDAPEYEEWIARERERLRRAAIRGYEALSRHHSRINEVIPALAAVDAALALDPFQEDLQRAALALHSRAGDRAGAIRRFEEFRRALDEAMGVPPLAETQALYDAIVTDAPLPDGDDDFVALPIQNTRTNLPAPAHTIDPARKSAYATPAEISTVAPSIPSHAASFSLPFIGRAQELRQLAAWQESRRLTLVEGEPGVGKTSLIEQFLFQRVKDKLIVLTGRARELESRLPYQPVIESVRAVAQYPQWPQWRAAMQVANLWQNEVARLTPELCPASAWENSHAGRMPDASAPTDADASRLWEGFYQWLAALAQLRPVVLFLDDIHWADTATLGLLGYLTRRIAAGSDPIQLLAAAPPIPPRTAVATLIQTLMREELLHQLTLHSLTSEDVTALAQQLSPQYGHPLGAWLYRSSEGAPFVLMHLVRYAREINLLDDDGAVNLHRLPTEPVVPHTVYSLIQSRLERLSEAARRVLDAAVAVGREFDFEVVARASALSDSAALDALDELRGNRMIQVAGPERFTFDHTLTREVAYREVGEIRHRLLHRRVAAALESLYPDRLDEMAGLLAHHYSEGNAPEQAYVFALRAGRRAASVAAWASAASFYQQALDHMPVAASTSDRLTLLAALGKAHLHAGDSHEAILRLRQVVDEAQITSEIALLDDALQALGEALLNHARYQDVIELAESMQQIEDSRIRFTVDFIWAAGLALGGVDLETATQHLLAVEARLAGASDPVSRERLAQINFELGGIDAQQGRLPEAVARYRQTLSLTDSIRNENKERWQILAHNNLAYHLHLLDDPTAIDHAQRGYQLARERGFLNLHGYLLSTLGEIYLAQGDLEQAEKYFAQGLALAKRLVQPERMAGITANLGRAALARRQPQQAAQHFSDALAQAEAIANPYLTAQIRLWLAPLVPPDAARQHLEAAHTIIATAGYAGLHEQWRAVQASLQARAAAL